MQMRQRAGMGLVIGVLCCVAYLRADRVVGLKSVGESVSQPNSESMGPLHRIRLLDENGQGVPHGKVSWSAPDLPMAGGLSDLHGQFELRVPRDFIGPVTFRVAGRPFMSLLPQDEEIGLLHVGNPRCGMVVTGSVGSAMGQGGGGRLYFHQAQMRDFEGAEETGARGDLALGERGVFRLTGVMPAMILVVSAVASSRVLPGTGIRWQPTVRKEWTALESTNCCLTLGLLEFGRPNLFGRVLSEAGLPVADVLVTYRPQGIYLSVELAGRGQLPFSGAPPMSRTNARGEFAFSVSPDVDVGVVDLSHIANRGELICWEGLKVVRTLNADDNELVFHNPLENGP